ncbi:hypothetical protein Cni_G25441 [Canna indica]|uniref:Uncharacterized protein n=1 Tax=Canna indica TaxID=4628 RepID=A0AAQ3KWZ8_9LILI|nr:hypothetical protein Cni_G25441 [Canna indica]
MDLRTDSDTGLAHPTRFGPCFTQPTNPTAEILSHDAAAAAAQHQLPLSLEKIPYVTKTSTRREFEAEEAANKRGRGDSNSPTFLPCVISPPPAPLPLSPLRQTVVSLHLQGHSLCSVSLNCKNE